MKISASRGRRWREMAAQEEAAARRFGFFLPPRCGGWLSTLVAFFLCVSRSPPSREVFRSFMMDCEAVEETFLKESSAQRFLIETRDCSEESGKIRVELAIQLTKLPCHEEMQLTPNQLDNQNSKVRSSATRLLPDRTEPKNHRELSSQTRAQSMQLTGKNLKAATHRQSLIEARA